MNTTIEQPLPGDYVQLDAALAHLKDCLLSDSEIEKRRADDWGERVTQYRREAGCPPRAMRWCAKRETALSLDVLVSGHAGWDKALCQIAAATERASGATIAVVGQQGRGKTTLATALIRFVTARERTAKWGDVVGFVLAMQDAKVNGRQMAEFRDWERPHVLVLDQADKMPNAEWENRLAFRLIDHRHNAQKVTVLLLNTTAGTSDGMVGAAECSLGASVLERIREAGGLVVADWEVLR